MKSKEYPNTDKSMNTAIQNVVGQYAGLFLDTASEKFNVPREQLEEVWKESIKTRLKRRSGTKQSLPSAYILFCKDHREKVKQSNPDLKFGEVARQLGLMWRNLNAADKKVYEDRRQSTTTPEATPVPPPAAPPATEEKPKKKRAKAT